jgi:hypothetical protein
MTQLTALAVSITLLGALWVYLALGPLMGLVLVWAGFIAWGCFFHSGGNQDALKKTIAGMVYGSLVANIALYLIVHDPLKLPFATAALIYVAVTVFFLVIVAKANLLSVVPANVYGYAATVAYAVQTPTAHDKGPLASLTSADFSNPFLLLSLSFIFGAVFGWISGMLAGKLTKS